MPLVRKDTHSVSTPTHTTFSERTSKQQVLVQIVFHKGCVAHLVKTLEPLHEYEEASESYPFTATQEIS